ncbi:MAG TPA: hypothetical protein VK900_13935 [Anaerolineales bacterium]|nr:hypothetical protein [Anaerolineales bacterium]
MNEFFTNEELKLNLKIAEHGLVFLFRRANGGPSDTLEVNQSWMNVHTLLCRLRKGRRYCAKDRPLLVWQEDEQLHIKYFWPDDQVVEECVFSSFETTRILTMLEKLPNMN